MSRAGPHALRAFPVPWPLIKVIEPSQNTKKFLIIELLETETLLLC